MEKIEIESMLEMDPKEFFEVKRLQGLGIPHNIAVRVARCTEEMKFQDPRSSFRRYELKLSTMRDFLARYPNRHPFTRQVDMGKKTVDAAVFAILSAGLTIDDK